MRDGYDPHDHYWIVGPDGPVYSSAAQGYVDAAPDGREATVIASEAELIGVLRAANVPPHHSITKSTVVFRLMDAGKLAEALAVLDAPESRELRAVWDAVTMIEMDHPMTAILRDVLTGIGAGADEILAPE